MNQAAAVTPGTIKPVRLALGLSIFLCICACDSPTDSPQGVCGLGQATVTIGIDDPLVEVTDQHFNIDEGNQGGYHVDVSVRVVGLIDPDNVNIRMTLSNGDTQISMHRTDAWLLKIYESGPHCEYPRARLVLTNPDDSLMELEKVEALVGQSVQLNVELNSPDGDANESFEITLSTLVRQQ